MYQYHTVLQIPFQLKKKTEFVKGLSKHNHFTSNYKIKRRVIKYNINILSSINSNNTHQLD